MKFTALQRTSNLFVKRYYRFEILAPLQPRPISQIYAYTAPRFVFPRVRFHVHHSPRGAHRTDLQSTHGGPKYHIITRRRRRRRLQNIVRGNHCSRRGRFFSRRGRARNSTVSEVRCVYYYTRIIEVLSISHSIYRTVRDYSRFLRAPEIVADPTAGASCCRSSRTRGVGGITAIGIITGRYVVTTYTINTLCIYLYTFRDALRAFFPRSI